MRLLLNKLLPSLKEQGTAIERCLRAMDQAMPLRAVYLFGSHVRGEARPDSDVDLCVVADDAERQIAELCEREIGYELCSGKLAEVIEKLMKAELIRMGWALEKTHDLRRCHL